MPETNGGVFRDAPVRRAFTLIELLIVISIMALLGLIIVGGSRMLFRKSREGRVKITREALNTAIHRYRAEYQRWPVSLSDKNWDKEGSDAIMGDYKKWVANNSRVFDALRTCNSDKNPDGLRFFDESTLMTTDTGTSAGKMIPLSQAGVEGGKNLFYARKLDNKPAPFSVTIWFDLDECKVGPDDGELESGEQDSDDAKYDY